MGRKNNSRRKKKTKGNAQRNSIITLFIAIAAIVYFVFSQGIDSFFSQFTRSTQYTGTLISAPIDDLDMARTPLGTPSQIIRHKGYTLSYNKNWHIANWVAYELTAEETEGKEERSDWFAPDPAIKDSPKHGDYTHSGYDRGHLAPAADMKWDKQAMEESFYMSNICPQVHGLNAGLWNQLENKVRTWAQRDSAIIVVCGPIVESNPMTIGEKRVAVPKQFYKIVASPYNSTPQGIAFLFDNEDLDGALYRYALSIDSIENLTGIDFLYNLPDSLENYIEHNIDPEAWQL